MNPDLVLPHIQRLKGRRESLQLDALRVEKAVGIAKARQEHKESVEGVLDDLERRFHERSMGILESLLGAFLNDVLPRGTDMGEQSVTMSLDTQRGLPALQVAVRNGEQVEDALRGRGGSVANVLSAGLRFIAIARTGGRANTLQGVRPFLVLDEADCWLSPERVPAFSEVIHSLTYDLGVQVLMISHHDTALLKGFPVHLERVAGEDGFPSVRARHLPLNPVHLVSDNTADDAADLENEKLSEDSYTRLTSIRLENFLSHEDSLIPLTAGVTVLTGDNDVGKSAVTEAFRAIAYNDSSDAVIRHGASESRVSLLFADGTRITWVRVRKGSPKTSYQLYADNDLIRETPAPKEVPEWVRILLGMDLREKMDV
ncbi:MAG: AAA family ATPase, partial [Acidithiobacillus sp.]